VAAEAFSCRVANLLLEYGIGGDTFFFDELLDLVDTLVND
jgi:hypothetical protein